MTVHVAFVRAVMIGREGLHRPVLLEMFERAGATAATSYISTGNVSFEVDPGRLATVTAQVEADLVALLGRPTPLFVRTVDQLAALLDDDPFATEPDVAVRERGIHFLPGPVPSSVELPISAARGDWITFGAGPAELFSVTAVRDDGRHPQAPGGRLERLLGTPITSRAVGTVERIVEKLTAP